MTSTKIARDVDPREFRFFRGREDFRTLSTRIRQQGVVATVRFACERVISRIGWQGYYLFHRFADRRFDRIHNVDTCGILFNDDLTVVGNNRASGLEYEATPVRALDGMLAQIGTEFSEFTFVDYGCGKGRTLLLASLHSFRRIRGVEFVKELQEIAARNIEHFDPPGRKCHDVEAILQDGAEYQIPDDNCVFYFYFPFREDVFRVVVNNIVSSYRRRPRKMYFIIRLDKPDWTEITQRVFGEHEVLESFGPRPDASRVRVVPFDTVYYRVRPRTA